MKERKVIVTWEAIYDIVDIHVLRVLTSDQKWEELFEDDVEYTYPAQTD